MMGLDHVDFGNRKGRAPFDYPLTSDLRGSFFDEIYENDEGGALRLEERTELDEAYAAYVAEGLPPELEFFKRLICVRDYGDGLIEVGYASCDLRKLPTDSEIENRKKELAALTAQEREQLRIINLDRSLRRTRAQVRRKCMAGGLDHLLTLTYRRNATDVPSAYRDFTRFIRLVREVMPNWKYVAVHELQKRGAVHFHLAVKGFQDVRLLRRLWLSVVSDGNIDVKGPKGRGSAKWMRAKLAGYLTKYITKALSSEFARQRYRVAQGIELPKHQTIIEFPIGFDFVSEIFDSLGSIPAFRWDSEDGPYGWACSW